MWTSPVANVRVLRRERFLTLREKAELRGRVFRNADLAGADFSRADLRDAWFIEVDLRDCDFSGADLRGAGFLGCDLRRACFAGARLGPNEFEGSWFTGARGLCTAQRKLIVEKGGFFLRAIDGARRARR